MYIPIESRRLSAMDFHLDNKSIEYDCRLRTTVDFFLALCSQRVVLKGEQKKQTAKNLDP